MPLLKAKPNPTGRNQFPSLPISLDKYGRIVCEQHIFTIGSDSKLPFGDYDVGTANGEALDLETYQIDGSETEVLTCNSTYRTLKVKLEPTPKFENEKNAFVKFNVTHEGQIVATTSLTGDIEKNSANANALAFGSITPFDKPMVKVEAKSSVSNGKAKVKSQSEILEESEVNLDGEKEDEVAAEVSKSGLDGATAKSGQKVKGNVKIKNSNRQSEAVETNRNQNNLKDSDSKPSKATATAILTTIRPFNENPLRVETTGTTLSNVSTDGATALATLSATGTWFLKAEVWVEGKIVYSTGITQAVFANSSRQPRTRGAFAFAQENQRTPGVATVAFDPSRPEFGREQILLSEGRRPDLTVAREQLANQIRQPALVKQLNPQLEKVSGQQANLQNLRVEKEPDDVELR